MGHKGHWGEYTGNAKWSKDHAHTKVTKDNYKATEKDDAAHIDYLKRDIDYDNKHGHSDENMTADEKHISKLAGDMKYDKEHHGSPAKHKGDTGHKKTFDYGDGQDNKRKKEHKKKTYHSPDGTHGSFADVKRARENVPTKMISPLRHERKENSKHLHASIKKRIQPIVDKQTGKRLPKEKK